MVSSYMIKSISLYVLYFQTDSADYWWPAVSNSVGISLQTQSPRLSISDVGHQKVHLFTSKAGTFRPQQMERAKSKGKKALFKTEEFTSQNSRIYCDLCSPRYLMRILPVNRCLFNSLELLCKVVEVAALGLLFMRILSFSYNTHPSLSNLYSLR
ncbi:hypothetical protein C5167_029785, partial [Papaver somniferum]